MSTLETQYKNFRKDNPNAKIHFEAWKKINARLVEQALVNMMKADEELKLYDEPFKHKVETIPSEEILANRSNAYEFIDFDKQKTLEEVAKNNYKRLYEGEPLTQEVPIDAFINGAKWQQEQIGKSEFLQKLRGTKSDAEARRLILETFKNK